MDSLFDGTLGAATLALLAIGLLFALSFEFVNGFHDTANAVATVIYTHSLPPNLAVLWSGAWNFLGVLTSSGAVAYGIVALLPVELVLHVGSHAGFAMVFSLLLSAIIWNLGTWYLGLPASSSHTLVGSIVGVGLMNAWLSGEGFGEGINWAKLQETMFALLTSPLIGFALAALLLALAKRLIRKPALFQAPEGKMPPPLWIRGILVLTCTGVSFAHGSNDGQKGMGLVMLVLIGLAPSAFALHMPASTESLQQILEASRRAAPILDKAPTRQMDEQEADRELSNLMTTGRLNDNALPALALKNRRIAGVIGRVKTLGELTVTERTALRQDIYLLVGGIKRVIRTNRVGDAEAATLDTLQDRLLPITEYIPMWAKLAVALSLGLGTMIGWKRIVTTIGEKIGKSHLTYAQGASAELVAMGTIGLADFAGVPVSTTHILTSGIAGTMFANRSGLQRATLRDILLAWVLTVPACVLLGSALFAAILTVVLRLFA